MENRFGFKDLISTVLIILLIVVVVLGMKQLDRQWMALQTIQDQGKEQTRLLASISRSLDDLSANGISVSNSNGSQATTQPSASGKLDFFGPLKAAEKMPGFARGDYLIDNFQSKIGGTLTPNVAIDLYSQWVETKVFDWLAAQDPNTLEYIPELARDWQISPDGLTYTFDLRRGVRFSDGEPFTADDVVYSFDFVMNPKINCPAVRSYFTNVKSAEKLNDYRVAFHMSEPYFNTLNLITSNLYILPKHFYSQFTPEEINENPGLVMGTGPYRLPDPKSWRPGQKIELVRNELYWGIPPAFDKIAFNEVEEEAAQETMFRNGELDVYRCYAPQFARLMKDQGITPKSTPHAINSFLNGYFFLAWNEKQAGKATQFSDRRVRKAMALLTDRQGICTQIYRGFATPISGPFWPGSPQADPSLHPLPYDPAAAKKLLADAGFLDRDGSGVLKSPAGVPLQFKLMYGGGNATVEQIVLFLKDNFAKAGVTMIPDPQQWAVMMQRMQHRDYDALFMGWGGGTVETDLYQFFDSSQIEGGGDDFMSYLNPELDKLIREARRTLDDDKRMKLWQQCDRILYEDQPYTFLLQRQELMFIANRIHNVQKTKVGLNVVDTWPNPIPWFVPKGMQKYTQ